MNYVREILESYFVLCPRGFSPSTYRMYEVMALGRCPVVIADEWISPKINAKWENALVFIKEKQVADIDNILRSLGPQLALKKGAYAQAIWLEEMNEEVKYKRFMKDLIEIYHQGEYSKEQLFSYWRSRPFRKENKWLISQKIKNKIISK